MTSEGNLAVGCANPDVESAVLLAGRNKCALGEMNLSRDALEVIRPARMIDDINGERIAGVFLLGEHVNDEETHIALNTAHTNVSQEPLQWPWYDRHKWRFHQLRFCLVLAVCPSRRFVRPRARMPKRFPMCFVARSASIGSPTRAAATLPPHPSLLRSCLASRRARCGLRNMPVKP